MFDFLHQFGLCNAEYLVGKILYERNCYLLALIFLVSFDKLIKFSLFYFRYWGKALKIHARYSVLQGIVCDVILVGLILYDYCCKRTSVCMTIHVMLYRAVGMW
jgi:hypothetical protein